MDLYNMDIKRYENKKDKMLKFLKCFRIINSNRSFILKTISKVIIRKYKKRFHFEIPNNVSIGGGLYIGHPLGISINPNSVLGKNINIHKGVTIGSENRGKRKGAPVIGNDVWIGINSTIVGAIKIGNDVLIAPNSFVNIDVPDHSIVFGNPCMIKPCKQATENYILNKA